MDLNDAKTKGVMDKSPLLSKEEVEGVDNTPHNSAIQPDKLDKTRFTERKALEEESSPLRIIIYVVIVIAVGVGAALLVRNLITKNEEVQEETQQQTQQTQPEFSTAYSINKTPKADSEALSAPTNDDYVDSTLVSVGNSDDSGQVDINKLMYDRYQTFARVTVDLSGIAIPSTDIEYDSVKKMLTVKLTSIANFDPELLKDATINDIVKEVRYNQNNTEFIIFVSENFKYAVQDLNGDLVIDIKPLSNFVDNDTETQAPEQQEEEEPTQQEEPQAEAPSTDDSRPAAPFYTNEFSQNTQYVSSNVSGNTISMNEFYYEDAGSFFELSWGSRNNVGDNFVPNSKAYYKTEAGVEYLFVELENLSQDAFQVRGLSETDLSNTGLNLSGTNFSRIKLVSFENGKATYRIQVKKKANFKLLTQKTVSGETQVLSIQIAD